VKWIKTGLQLGQAVKNAQRLRQIVGVFARYGFGDVARRLDLEKFLPARTAEEPGAEQATLGTPQRMRMAFEELGPTFVKLGQLLSTRPDLLPEEFIEEFTRLQDNVQPLPFATVRGVVERELGRSLSECYATFEEAPLAAASIGQVHAATLLSGEKVVVKVQRPEIAKLVEVDISLLAFLAGLLERAIPETRVFAPKTVVSEFFRTLSYELDYVVEANNMTKIAQNLASIPEVVIPKVFKSLSTSRVLTLERLEGVRVNDLKALDAAGIDRRRVVQIGTRAFFKAVIIDGLFHGDLHGGNLFVLPGNRLGIIDFGIVGRLSERSRGQLANMVQSLLNEDYGNLCYQYAELGAAGPAIDFDSFERDVRNTIAPYLGLSLDEINIGKILIEATRVATRYEIQIPGDWMIVFKAILTIEGMGRTLAPGFDMMSEGQALIVDLLKHQYSMQRLRKDLLWVGRDAVALLQVLPRQLLWMFKKLNSNDFAFEIKVPELLALRRVAEEGSRRTSLAILAAGALIASSLALPLEGGRRVLDYPLPAAVYLVIAGFLAFRILFR
jgi:ubiquinone biosynthesis protein